MNTPLITWGCIVALFACMLPARLIAANRSRTGHRPPLVGFGSEREAFFIPGDPTFRQTKEYEDEDDDL